VGEEIEVGEGRTNLMEEGDEEEDRERNVESIEDLCLAIEFLVFARFTRPPDIFQLLTRPVRTRGTIKSDLGEELEKDMAENPDDGESGERGVKGEESEDVVLAVEDGEREGDGDVEDKEKGDVREVTCGVRHVLREPVEKRGDKVETSSSAIGAR